MMNLHTEHHPSALLAAGSGVGLGQQQAILQADRLFRSLRLEEADAVSACPWREILAPQCVLYFGSKILRVGAALRDHRRGGPAPTIENALGATAARYHAGVVRDERGWRPRLGEWLAGRDFSLIASWRLLQSCPVAPTARGLSPGGGLIYAPNAAHVAMALGIAGSLGSVLPATVVTRVGAAAGLVLEGTFRNGRWRETVTGLQPSLLRWLALFTDGFLSGAFAGEPWAGRPALREALLGRLRRAYLPQAADAVAVAQGMLDQLRPRVVLIQDLGDFRARALAIEAGRRRIPVCHLQFGCVFPSAIEWGWDVADHHLLWGEWSRNMALALGISGAKIKVTGAPRFRPGRTSHRPWEGRRLLFPLIPASPLEFGNGGALTAGECQKVGRLLREWAARNPDYCLRVKRRPLNDESGFDELLNCQLPNVVVLDGRCSMEEVLADTDVVITTHSTTGIEAIIGGFPLIVIDWGFRPHPFAFLCESGAAMMVDSPETLAATLHGLRENPEAKARLLKHQRQVVLDIAPLTGELACDSISGELTKICGLP